MPAPAPTFAAVAAKVATALVADSVRAFAEVVVPCDVGAADRLFARWNGYIPAGKHAPGRAQSRQRRIEQIDTCPDTLRAPTVFLSRAGSTSPRIRFIDGRHLFCVLRDAGAKTINLAMSHEHAAAAGTLGLYAKDHRHE